MELTYRPYQSEKDLPAMSKLIEEGLSEPYSIFTYRFFTNDYPHLSELCFGPDGQLIGVVVCKVESHKSGTMRGYIGMLAVEKEFRKHKIATKLVETVMKRMEEMGIVDECVFEAELSNTAALSFYRNLGFVRTKRLNWYYLNGSDAFRLKKPFNREVKEGISK